MTYNRNGYFNRYAYFNRAAADAPADTFSGSVELDFDDAADGWHATISYGDSFTTIDYALPSGWQRYIKLSTTIPLAAADSVIDFSTDQTRISATASYGTVSDNAAVLDYRLTADEFSVQNHQYISLLAPWDEPAIFQHVVIDTGAMTVTGENDVSLLKCWGGGSEFFMLQPGSNTLRFGTYGGYGWTATITITYEERWL